MTRIRKCLRCDHEWATTKRLEGREPKQCPSCKSAYWNTERRK